MRKVKRQDLPLPLLRLVQPHDFHYALDCAKIVGELDWQPRVQFEERLRWTVKWYLEHPDWVESVITGEYQEYYRKIYKGGR